MFVFLQLLDELSAVPERLLDPQENEAAHTWCYLDAFNKACLAPLTLSLVSVFFKNCGSHVTDSPVSTGRYAYVYAHILMLRNVHTWLCVT